MPILTKRILGAPAATIAAGAPKLAAATPMPTAAATFITPKLTPQQQVQQQDANRTVQANAVQPIVTPPGCGLAPPPPPSYMIGDFLPVDVNAWLNAIATYTARGKQDSTRLVFRVSWPFAMRDPTLLAIRTHATTLIWTRMADVGQAFYNGMIGAIAEGSLGSRPSYVTSKNKSSVPVEPADFNVTCPGSKATPYRGLYFVNAGDGAHNSAPNCSDNFPVMIPLVEGIAPLWIAQAPKAITDVYGHTDQWLVYVRWVNAESGGGDVFEFTLTPKPNTFDLVGDIGALFTDVANILVTALKYACEGLTDSRVQGMVNYAAAVKDPHVKTALAAWSVVGAACGIAFPTNPTAVVPDPCALTPPTPPAPVPVTFWSEYKWWVVGASALAVGAVGISVYRRRRGSVVA